MGRPRNFEPDAVVEQAMEAFWTYGYAGTSPALLATATGIGKGSLYHLYGSKRQLFEQAIARYDRLGRENAAELLDRPGPVREVVREFLRALTDSDLAHPVRRGCLAVNVATELAAHDPDIARAVHDMQEHVVVELTGRLERAVREGDLGPGTDPRAAAEFLMNTIAGLRVMTRTYDAPSLYRIIDTAVGTL
ncbi:TetR/AcrR family transcriptional regulator [Nocardia sp. alder85J]|uniref:TetR/AcrR family transcriptional regulator n=1 Tax=Nocardia sp. alder85J TaxID=2862949 RepID=UPI001CD2D6A1|nr:TetR/AcrR family transcriptional regulator [Nocardia sp. alder85J]MCX4094356.1 TetR/AcrR family transcriptional regulator [Nocardia sp. alder85J]